MQDENSAASLTALMKASFLNIGPSQQYGAQNSVGLSLIRFWRMVFNVKAFS